MGSTVAAGKTWSSRLANLPGCHRLELALLDPQPEKAGAPRSGRRGSCGRGEDLVPTHRPESGKAQSLDRAESFGGGLPDGGARGPERFPSRASKVWSLVGSPPERQRRWGKSGNVRGPALPRKAVFAPSSEGDRGGVGFAPGEAGTEDEGEVREPQRAASPFVLDPVAS